MRAPLRAWWFWVLLGGTAAGCLSSLDERNLDGADDGDAGEGGNGGNAATAGKGGTTGKGGSSGSTSGAGGSAGTHTQAGSTGSGSGATGGTNGATGGASGRGGSSGSQNGGTDAGTTGASGESGAGGGGAGGNAGVGGSDTGGAGSGGAGGATAGSAGIGGGNGGGSANAGGSGNVGGSDGSPTCGTSFAVGPRGYVTSPGASGCWRGHAFTSVGGNTTLSPASFESCGQSCSLCVQGTVQGNDEYSSYALLGINLNQLLDSTTVNTVVPEAQSLTLSFSNEGGALVRVQLIPLDGGVPWCHTLTGQGTVNIPYSDFRQSCWDDTGLPYAGEPLASVSLIVPGGAAGQNQPYDVCITDLGDG